MANKKGPAAATPPEKKNTENKIDFGLFANQPKLLAAQKYIAETMPHLAGGAKNEAIKARYLETKGGIKGEERHKNGKTGRGTPRPTSDAAKKYDGIDDSDDEDEGKGLNDAANGISTSTEVLGADSDDLDEDEDGE